MILQGDVILQGAMILQGHVILQCRVILQGHVIHVKTILQSLRDNFKANLPSFYIHNQPSLVLKMT